MVIMGLEGSEKSLVMEDVNYGTRKMWRKRFTAVHRPGMFPSNFSVPLL